MQETHIFEYYAFGYNFAWLRLHSTAISIHEGYDSLEGQLELFFQFLDTLNLEVTKKASFKLANIARKIKALPANAIEDASLNHELIKAINNMEQTLDAELKLRTAYCITMKRYSIDNLLKTPEKLFPQNLFASLPELCRYDFKEACLCIAFDRPTAAAFHLMRTAEGVLRYYYCSVIKRNRVKRFLWNEMLEHLKKKTRAKFPKPLLDNLDNVRDNFRNPTQHPEKRYEIDEAQDLLAICIDVISRMIKDLELRLTTPL